MKTPLQVAGDVARALEAHEPTIRSAVRRKVPAWSFEDAVGWYTTVKPVTSTPDLRGDAATINDAILIQVDLWEHDDTEDPSHLAEILVALDGVKLKDQGHSYAGRVDSIVPVDDPEPGVIHHAITMRYPAAR